MKEVIIICAPCGCGKSTLTEEINRNNQYSDCLAVESDILNWWDYASTANEENYFIDSLNVALELTNNKKLIFTTCVNPVDVRIRIENTSLKSKINLSKLKIIGLVCDELSLEERLLARPAERNCSDPEFIKSQIWYMNWFKTNEDKFDLLIDNTNQEVAETAIIISRLINSI